MYREATTYDVRAEVDNFLLRFWFVVAVLNVLFSFAVAVMFAEHGRRRRVAGSHTVSDQVRFTIQWRRPPGDR
jgi:hypothetical protein